MKLCGLGDPILRRPTAFLLNYIPILGRMTGVVIFFLVGIVTFDWPWYAFVPAGIYLLIHIAEGETITPMLPAKRFTLNPVLVTVSLFPLAYSLGHPRHAPCRASWRSSRLSPTVLSR
jgi:predicted PurR-regulated permease PerM